jgi:pimeloyl-ACP methyl ester carboxylesterase
MPYELPPDPSTARRERVTQWITFAFAAVLVALVAYFGYVGYEGSRQFTDAPAPAADCRTPATFGWGYEAINYDQASDAALAGEADPTACSAQGQIAGDEVTGPDGIGLAGWYVPAASGAPPTAPTVILAHGWGSNKSAMLDRAAILHESYHLLLFDFRNHGQSEGDMTTQGVRESADLRAVIDWLVETKVPEQIAVLGTSMGGAVALHEAVADERVDALILDSTHATLSNALQARLDRAGYPLSLPAAWSVLLASLIRTGQDISAADPVQRIGSFREPVLIIVGGQDDAIGPTDGQDLLASAREGSEDAELRVCEAAGHGQPLDACPDDYREWVLGFLARSLAP